MASTTIRPKSNPEHRVCEFIRTQRAVKIWIETVLNINGKLDEDLHKSLKSGVILCYLMLEIEERSIPRIQENTDAAFKLKENVSFFLSAVRDYGVPIQKLFHPNDLEGNNMVHVIECLATLATIAQSKNFRVPLSVVPEAGEFTDANILKRLSQQQLNLLNNQLKKVKDKPASGHKTVVSANIMRRKIALLSKGIDMDKLEKKIAKIQALWRGYQVRKLYQKRVRDQAYRDNVAKEILSTEQVYVKNLGLCISVFLNPLREAIAKKKPIIEESQIKALFSDIEIIHQFNKNLLADLEPIVENWSPKQCLGKIFLKIMDFLKIYRGYVQNFNNSLEALNQCRKKSSFEKFLLECKTVAEINLLDLSSFLIMPVQRIPRYNMLLRDLVKHTWEDHPDYTALKQAVARVEDIAGFLNEKKREAENIAELIEMENHFTGKNVPSLASASRTFIKRFEVSDHKSGKTYVLYLFNDMLLIGKIDTKKKILKSLHITDEVKYKEHHMLSEVEIIDLVNVEICKIAPKKLRLWYLTCSDLAEKAELFKGYNSLNKEKEKKGVEIKKQEDLKASTDLALTPDIKGAEEELSKRRKEQTLRARAKSETPKVDPNRVFGSSPVTSPTTAMSPTLISSAPVTPTTTVERKPATSVDESLDLLETEKTRKQLLERKDIIVAQLKGLEEMMEGPKRDKKLKISSQQAAFAKQLHGELDGELTYVEKELARLDTNSLRLQLRVPSEGEQLLTEEEKKKEEKRVKKEEKLREKEKRMTLRREKEKLKEEIKKEKEQQKTLKRMSKKAQEDIAISDPVFIESKVVSVDSLASN